ncbi:MAG: translation initiation factor IF-3 [Planctomycetota bacterium]|nr:translation initiation factor IF-3 [Planctomycetota bacterium]MEE2896544.1 translation initiation factor IF-3 [Planctomycetota bacterium]
MRRRGFGREEMRPTGPRMNERIRISPIRLIDENGEQAGVVETQDALRRARDLGMDLVEMAADSRPPVCRIMDYGRYKYEQSKKEKANKAKTKTSELKEVRMGRSMKIDPHDVAIRMRQARKFLLEGHKVQIVQQFRGREMAHRERGNERMREIIAELEEIGKVETEPRMAGRRMNVIIGPDKRKIEAYRRKMEAEGKATEEHDPKVAEEAKAVAAADAAEATEPTGEE